jgi:excisionase family DNA binding protein
MSLLTTKETADRLGVSVRRVHQFIEESRLPAEKMGRDYFIKEEDLKLLEDRKPGRPPKVKTEASSKAGKKRGGKESGL